MEDFSNNNFFERIKLDLLSFVNSLDPHDNFFKQLYSTMSKKVAWLRTQEGRLPFELFMANLEASGTYPCYELVITTPDYKFIYLRPRDPKENITAEERSAWAGLHIPGITVNTNIRNENNFLRLLLKEFVSVEATDSREKVLKVAQKLKPIYESVRVLGQVTYPEPERHTSAATTLLIAPVDDEKILNSDFVKIPLDPDNVNLQIITQHRDVVLRIARSIKNTPNGFKQKGLFVSDFRLDLPFEKVLDLI